MYRYDTFDKDLVNRRVGQFRNQTRRFLAGKLSEDEFRPLRLENGLYVQKHAPMLRVAIPYGLLCRGSCASSLTLPASMTDDTVTSPRDRTSSSAGRRWKPYPTFSRTRRRRDARHPDLGQLRAQHDLRSAGTSAARDRISRGARPRRAPLPHGGQRRRLQEHADRTPPVRHQGDPRGPARGPRANVAAARHRARPGAFDRRPHRGARARDHHRRRVSLFRGGAAQVHHRRCSGPRAVHAQYGDRGVDGAARASRRQPRTSWLP